MVVGAEHGDRRGGLGEAVGVHETDVGEQAQRVEQHPLGHLGTAVRQRPQGRHVGGLVAHGLDDARQHRRHDHRVGDAFAADRFEPHRGVEGAQVHEAATGEGVRQHVRHTGHVIRRDGHEDRFVLAGASELDGAEEVRHEVTVAQQRRLRFGRGAARVEHDGDVVVVERRVDGRHVGRQ